MAHIKDMDVNEPIQKLSDEELAKVLEENREKLGKLMAALDAGEEAARNSTTQYGAVETLGALSASLEAGGKYAQYSARNHGMSDLGRIRGPKPSHQGCTCQQIGGHDMTCPEYHRRLSELEITPIKNMDEALRAMDPAMQIEKLNAVILKLKTDKCRWIRQFDGHFAISCPSGQRANGSFRGKGKIEGARWEFTHCPYCGREIEEYFDREPCDA